MLEEKKIPYEYKEINPYKKEKEFLAFVSMLREVPMLTSPD